MQTRRTDRSRNLILDAAEATFREQDFGTTSVEEISMRAGLTRKTVYNLFSSKEDIIAQLRARAEARHYPPIRQRIADGHAALAILEDTLVGHGRWCADNRNVAMQALAGSADKPAGTADSGDVVLMALITDILLLGQRQYVIRDDEDASIMALFLLGAHAQTVRYMLATGSFHENKLKYVLRLLIEGMGTPKAQRDPKTGPGPKVASTPKAKRRTRRIISSGAPS